MSRNLVDRCRQSFSAKRLRAGLSYYAQGLVKIDKVDALRLEASVQGSASEPYRVSLDWSLALDDCVLIASCTCPSYEQGDICKHIAATIWQADREGCAARVPGGHALDVIDDQSEWIADDDLYAPHGDDDDFYENDYSDHGRRNKAPRSAGKSIGAPKKADRPAAPPLWQTQLHTLNRDLAAKIRGQAPAADIRGREIYYRLNGPESAKRGALVIDFQHRERKLDGEFGKLKMLKVAPGEVATLPDPLDRELLGAMVGNRGESQYFASTYGSYYRYGYGDAPGGDICRCQLAPAIYHSLLPRLCATGRFDWLREEPAGGAEEPTPLSWDDGPPWQFKLHFGPAPEAKAWRLTGALQRPGGDVAADTVRFAGGGVIFFERTVARLDENASRSWIDVMQKTGPIEVPAKERETFLQQLWRSPELPPLELAEDLGWKTVVVEPTPRLIVAAPKHAPLYNRDRVLTATVSFDYRDKTIAWRDGRTVLADDETRELIRRDPAREQAFLSDLHKLPLQPPSGYGPKEHDAEIAEKRLPPVVAGLIAAGWRVEAEGAKIRRAGEFKINLSSSVDWFELDAAADFEGVQASLPALLKALQHGQSYVELDDGSKGLLPQEWLARYAPLAEMGTVDGNKIRFVPSQAMLLDAWLAAQPEVNLDAAFEEIRDRLRSFEGVKPAEEPVTFHGRLRGYQREGLGWLRFLNEFGFGGCLADDMGLGKTIQVLALLDSQRSDAGGAAQAAAAKGRSPGKKGAKAKTARFGDPIADQAPRRDDQ